ncbi:MAG: ferritin-like domain-containing protein [Actinomycetota bacterium]|nr:ferritin-like domain-containing protein [Actinomycetota bacterium]
MNRTAVAELLAALSYGGKVAAERARDNARFAPDSRTREAQLGIAERERRNSRLIEARLLEVGSESLTRRFAPFFDLFFSHTEPADWVEAQTFHYVGDALVSDFADGLVELLDPVSAEVVRRALGEREDQESFALEELTRAMEGEPEAIERIAAYARRIIGEALTQTSRALDQATVLKDLLGGVDGEKRFLLDLLERHRIRLDRLGIERVEAEPGD